MRRKTPCLDAIAAEVPAPDGASITDPKATSPKELTLADALRRFRSDPAIDQKRKDDMASAVSCCAKVFGRPAEDIPCEAVPLRAAFMSALPSMHRVKPKRFQNVRSLIGRLARHAHIIDEALSDPLPENWASTIAPIPNRCQRAAVARFGRFCAMRGIAPEKVNADLLERYRHWMTTRTLELRVNVTVGVVRCTWNRLVVPRAAGNLPRIEPPKSARNYARSADSIGAQFALEFEAYLAELADPNPLSGLGRKRSVVTVQHRRGLLLRHATAITECGRRVSCLHDLFDPENAKASLLWHYRRAGNRWTSQEVGLIGAIVVLAKHRGAPRSVIEELSQFRRAIPPNRAGLTARNRERLMQLDDPKMRAALAELPHDMIKQADAMVASRPVQAAKLHESAVALLISHYTGIRRRNLATIDINRHFQRDSRGRIVRLLILADETKGQRVTIDHEIGYELSSIIQRHIRLYRPNLPGSESPWLFASPNGKHRGFDSIARLAVSGMRRYLKLKWNQHGFRHNVVVRLEEEFENGIELASRLLAHSDSKITRRMYGEISSRRASREYNKLLESARTPKKRK